jgi:large subunit ribosomal protein L2
MGKRIIQQARGKGSKTYRVRRKAYRYQMKFPKKLEGEGKVLKLLNSAGHSYPIAKIKCSEGIFYVPAAKGMFEGQTIKLNGNEMTHGNITKIKNIPIKTPIYNIESKPFDGGKFVRSGGSSANINRIMDKKIFILMPSKKEKAFNPECRAMIGDIAGHGRLEKPVVKAGRRFHLMKAKNKLWPRTSALKVNAIDHPFGSGRGKNPKSKIAKRNAPPGAKVGLLRPKRTGRTKK